MLRSPRCLWQESYKGFCLHSADFISPTQDTICPAPTDIRYKWCHGMCCCASVDPMHNTIIPNFYAALGLFLHQPRENLINYSFHELIWELKCTACIFKAWRPQNPLSGVFFFRVCSECYLPGSSHLITSHLASKSNIWLWSYIPRSAEWLKNTLIIEPQIYI